MLVGMVGSLVGSDPVVYATISSNATNITLSNYFTAADWASSARKEVTINAGVTVGSTSFSSPALNTGTGRGGTLVLTNNGSILGAGGAGNSGTGGNGLNIQQNGFILRGNGLIYAGGGGGGKGGTGGGGLWYSGRLYNEGPIYNYPNNYYWVVVTFYDGTGEAPANGPHWNPYDASFSYYQGSYQGSYASQTSGDNPHTNANFDVYSVGRQKTIYDVPNYTSGGIGGNGGRGQGYDGSAASGSGGSSGGTNAGVGGTGGTGGGYGAAGAAGLTGNSGNNGGGSAGTGGGLAGFYITGSSFMTNQSSCTFAGRIS